MPAFSGRSKVLKISFLAILSAFAVELAFGLASGSLALITDSAHALLDAFVTLMLILAVKLAARPPDAEHTYGHGKMESLGSLFGGIALLAAAAFFAYGALSGLSGPPAPVGMLGLAGGAYAMCVDIFRMVLLRRHAGSPAVRADFYHAAADLGSTGLAVAGVALASSGVAGADSAAALVLSGLLAALSVSLVRRAALELTDAIPPELVARARAAALSTPGVSGAGRILMRRSGEAVFVDATVSVRGSESFEKAHAIGDAVAESIASRVPGASVTVHFEPAWEGVPAGELLERAALGVEGVLGVHNASVYRAGPAVLANLHVMVDGSKDLEAAHRISDAVEHRVLGTVGGIDQITVHLEPYVRIPEGMAEASGSEPQIRRAAGGHPAVLGVGRVVCLRMGGALKVDMTCAFRGSMPMSEVHDAMSDLEGRLHSMFPGSVVTIHPEPG